MNKNVRNSPQGALESIGRRDADREVFRAKKSGKRQMKWNYVGPKRPGK